MKLKFFAVNLLATTSVLAQLPSTIPSSKHPFTFEDMMKLKRVGAPVPSPDGKWVVFDAEDVDLEANTRISHLWIESRRTTTIFTRWQTADLDIESD